MTKEVKIGLTEAQRAKIAAATEKSKSESKVTVGVPVPESTAGRISRDALRAIGEQGRRDATGGEGVPSDAERQEPEEQELPDEEGVRETPLRRDDEG